MPRPRGDQWLSTAIQGLKSEKVDVIVSLLTDSEMVKLGVQDEKNECTKNDIQYINLPVVNFATPDNKSDFISLAMSVIDFLKQGKFVVIHCRMGIGRSGMLAAYVLCIVLNITTEEAFQRISIVRGQTSPDTEEQLLWVKEVVASKNI